MIIDKESKTFIRLIFFLFITLLLIFIFFYPKFEFEERDNLEYIGNLSLEETKTLILSNIQEGDIILNKPKSFSSYHNYYQEKHEKILSNIVFFFFYYNLFDNIFIKSMGDDGYWHVFIYTGNETLNSLLLLGVEQEKIDNVLIDNNLKIIRVDATNEIKKKAVENANMHLKNQDVYYSLKNGLIIVFAKSTGLDYIFKLESNRLVCSSYIALIYDINFNPKKHYTYITPVDIEESNIVKTIILKNEKGVYYGR